MYEITHSEKAIRLLVEENRNVVQQALEKIGKEHPESVREATELLLELMFSHIPFRFQ